MKQLSSPAMTDIDINELYLGVYLSDNTPVLFKVEGIYFLPIFSSVEKYETAMKLSNLPDPAKMQVVTDKTEFFLSISGKVRVMLDPWVTEEGNTRFLELKI